jgi:hypothetical protein
MKAKGISDWKSSDIPNRNPPSNKSVGDQICVASGSATCQDKKTWVRQEALGFIRESNLMIFIESHKSTEAFEGVGVEEENGDQPHPRVVVSILTETIQFSPENNNSILSLTSLKSNQRQFSRKKLNPTQFNALTNLVGLLMIMSQSPEHWLATMRTSASS